MVGKTQYETRSTLLGDYFSADSPTLLQIPHYQRGYSWKTQHISDFFSDLLEQITSPDQYFFGTFTTIDLGRTNGVAKFELIDGQQRATTSLILLTCIRDIFYEKNSALKDETDKDIFNVDVEKTQNEYYKLVLDDDDDLFFKDNILNKLSPDKIKEIKNARTILDTHKNLRDAYLQLRQEINNEFLKINSDTEKISFLNLLRSTLRKKFIISNLDVQKASHAYVLFNRMNDRGLNLAPADLAKDLLLSKVHEEVEVGIGLITKDDAIKKWKDLELRVEKKKTTMNNFIHHYLVTFHSLTSNKDEINARLEDVKKKAKSEGWDDKKIKQEKDIILKDLEEKFVFHPNSKTFDHLEQILYNKIMSGGELLNDLRTKFDNYEALKKAPTTAHPLMTSTCKENLKWINKLGIIIIYPVLLAGLEKYQKDDFEKLTEVLLKWFFRVKTVANRNASALEVELAQIAHEILFNDLPFEDYKAKIITKDASGKEIEKEIIRDGVKSKLSKSKYSISYDAFENNFKEISFGRDSATYVLTKIVEYQQHQKLTDVIPSNKITLEHIMPNNGIEKNIEIIKYDQQGNPMQDPDDNPITEHFTWLDYIMKENSFMDERDARSFHQNYKQRLGNLTLVDKQKNSVLGVHPFSRKCGAGKDKHGNEIGCFKNSIINLNKEILDWDVWNKNSIDERQKKLAAIAKDIWQI